MKLELLFLMFFVDRINADFMKKTKTKAEKRENKNKLKMKVSGKSVFKLKEIIVKKSQAKKI
jgi:hypothetical protein